jgi:hypothetical protein
MEKGSSEGKDARTCLQRRRVDSLLTPQGPEQITEGQTQRQARNVLE